MGLSINLCSSVSCIVGVSLNEPHINSTALCEIYMMCIYNTVITLCIFTCCSNLVNLQNFTYCKYCGVCCIDSHNSHKQNFLCIKISLHDTEITGAGLLLQLKLIALTQSIPGSLEIKLCTHCVVN